MAEYKGKLLKGIFTKASKCLLNSGASVESALSDSGWVTVNSYLSYRKMGNVVYVKLSAGYTVDANSWTLVGKLPVAPSQETFACFYYSNTTFVTVRLYTNGNVGVNGNNSLNGQVSFALG